MSNTLAAGRYRDSSLVIYQIVAMPFCALDVACAVCTAKAGEKCLNDRRSQTITRPHVQRALAARTQFEERSTWKDGEDEGSVQ